MVKAALFLCHMIDRIIVFVRKMQSKVNVPQTVFQISNSNLWDHWCEDTLAFYIITWKIRNTVGVSNFWPYGQNSGWCTRLRSMLKALVVTKNNYISYFPLLDVSVKFVTHTECPIMTPDSRGWLLTNYCFVTILDVNNQILLNK